MDDELGNFIAFESNSDEYYKPATSTISFAFPRTAFVGPAVLLLSAIPSKTSLVTRKRTALGKKTVVTSKISIAPTPPSRHYITSIGINDDTCSVEKLNGIIRTASTLLTGAVVKVKRNSQTQLYTLSANDARDIGNTFFNKMIGTCLSRVADVVKCNQGIIQPAPQYTIHKK
jgi:hypothetical protein